MKVVGEIGGISSQAPEGKREKNSQEERKEKQKVKALASAAREKEIHSSFLALGGKRGDRIGGNGRDRVSPQREIFLPGGRGEKRGGKCGVNLERRGGKTLNSTLERLALKYEGGGKRVHQAGKKDKNRMTVLELLRREGRIFSLNPRERRG